MPKDFNHITEEVKENLGKFEADETKLKSLLSKRDDEIAQLKLELEKKNCHLNNFVYAAAHALKSPIANLNLIAILLEKSKDLDEVKNYLFSIKSSISKMNNTIQGLVQGFQSQSLEEDPVVEIDFATFFNNLISRHLVNLNPDECPEFTFNFERCPSLHYMKNTLEDLSWIIISNSLKYKADERMLKVSITTSKIDNLVLLQIKDNGTGIDLEKYGKDVFMPFKKFSAKSDGNGLGLYVAKMLTENHGGKIELQSNLNEGTTVRLFLENKLSKNI